MPVNNRMVECTDEKKKTHLDKLDRYSNTERPAFTAFFTLIHLYGVHWLIVIVFVSDVNAFVMASNVGCQRWKSLLFVGKR